MPTHATRHGRGDWKESFGMFDFDMELLGK